MVENLFFTFKNNRDFIHEIVKQKYSSEPVIVKKAYLFAAEMLMQPIIMRDESLFACSRMHFSLPDAQGAEQLDREVVQLSELYPDQKAEFEQIYTASEIGILQRWAGGHTSASLELLFEEGYQNIIDKVLNKMSITKDEKIKKFYRAELIVLLAAQKQILRFGCEAKKRIGTAGDKYEKNKYLRIVSACKNIAYNPPKSFFEAVQLIAFTHEFCNIEWNGAGSQGLRIDQLLNSYYTADLKKGNITRDGALELMCSLWEFYETFGERCANLTIGGSDEYGNDMCNELTLICMEASMLIRADVPLLTLRVHPGLKDEVWNTALRLVRCGQGFPAFYNDVSAVRAKMNAGVSKKDAYDYSTLGCVELTIGGREFSHTEGARINWLKILELMIFNGTCQLTGCQWRLKETHDLEEFTCFEQFYNWFKTELKAVIYKVADFIDKASLAYSEQWPTPYLSGITYGCIEKGSDITARGTKYYNLSINCVGMANAVDSLEAIEKLIYKEKSVSFEQLKAALKSDFKGHDELRRKLLSCPKYGNDIDSVDQKMSDLMGIFSETVNSLKMTDNRGKFQCGFYSVMHHALLGMKTGASCDGRLSGTSLANSLSPAQGADKNGPTAVINSISKVSMKYMGNGGVLDMKFIPSFFDKKNHVQAFRYMIETYFDEGGLEVQFNVVSAKTLREAQISPEKYKNLVVRVSGYSAYFVKLEKELQDEIIRRTGNQFV